jgi:transcription initiation factor IIE alpha subunit
MAYGEKTTCGLCGCEIHPDQTAEIEELRAEVARLRDELDEAEEIIKRMMFEGA